MDNLRAFCGWTVLAAAEFLVLIFGIACGVADFVLGLVTAILNYSVIPIHFLGQMLLPSDRRGTYDGMRLGGVRFPAIAIVLGQFIGLFRK